MASMWLALLLAVVVVQDAPVRIDPRRQFDFWIGEWSVQNRDLQPDGSWKDGDVARARITPVCGGNAILEEWAGPFHGSFMNGFSLRAYDPVRRDWNLLLFWTTDGNGAFGRLRGRFRHGRGEFFAGGGSSLTRYSFSDGLPDSVRWDSATSGDAGVTWKTDWIMEFSRTRAAGEVTQDRLLEIAWTEGELSPHEAARELDWMLGSWEGIQTDAGSGEESEARLRCKLLDKDCLVLDVLETRTPDDEAWRERLSVRGFVPGRGVWESHSLSTDDTVIRTSVGTPSGDVAVFENPIADSGSRRETLRRLSDGVMAIEEERRAAEEHELVLVRVTELRLATGR